MTDLEPTDLEASSQRAESTAKTTTSVPPWRCFLGSAVAGTLSLLAYRLTSTIALTFANKPLTTDNATAQNIGAAVRTLVVGIVALGAGIFGIAALGLGALGLQLIFKKLKGATQANLDTQP